MKQETNKKWIIIIIFTMIISILLMILNIKKYNIYDVNKDGKVNDNDYKEIRCYLTTNETKYIERYDINKDGKVTAVDYAKVKNYVLGNN